MLSFDFLKRVWTSFSTTFCVWFFKKNVSHVIFYKLTIFNYVIAFTSGDSGQYVYFKFLLTRRHEFWNQPYLSNQTVFLHEQKVKYFKNEKSFKSELKSIFHHFWRAFKCKILSQTWKCAFYSKNTSDGVTLYCQLIYWHLHYGEKCI